MEERTVREEAFEYDVTGGPGAAEAAEAAEAVSASAASVVEARPAQERIRELFAKAKGLRSVFEGMIAFCREGKTPAEADEAFRALTEFNFCTFSSVRVRAMLEEVGALVYVEPEVTDADTDVAGAAVADSEGAADAQDVPSAQDAEEEAYYEITTRPEGLWYATPEGLEVIDARDKVAETLAVLGLEPAYAPEFIKVMQALLEGDKTMDELEEVVADDEIMYANGRYASFLIMRLEESGAVEYRGKWTLLDVGKCVLQQQ